MVLLHGRDRWKARNSCSPPFVLLMVRFIMHDTDGTETILSHYSLQTAGPKYFLHTYTCVFVPRLYRWFPILHLITYWVCHSTFATLFFRFFFLAHVLLSSYTYNGMSLKSECRSIRIDGPIFVKLCSEFGLLKKEQCGRNPRFMAGTFGWRADCIDKWWGRKTRQRRRRKKSVAD